MNYLFLFFGLIFMQSTMAQSNLFKYASTPELIFEKALETSPYRETGREYVLEKVGLIRCNRELSSLGKTIWTKCFNYFDNGSNPIFKKGTAQDIYYNGMRYITETWLTDIHSEKSALVICQRKGDEGVYNYKCQIQAMDKELDY